MSEFRPDENLTLVALKLAWPDRDDRDKPDWIADLDGTGTVRVRPLTFNDIVAWANRACEGDVE